VGLVFGNCYYAWMAGRLAYKENRDDVTAQPYGINTTGAFITLGAVNLTALFTELFKDKNLNKGFRGDWREAGQDVAENAYQIAVGANFYTGLMEIAGCLAPCGRPRRAPGEGVESVPTRPGAQASWRSPSAPWCPRRPTTRSSRASASCASRRHESRSARV